MLGVQRKSVENAGESVRSHERSFGKVNETVPNDWERFEGEHRTNPIKSDRALF